MKIEATLGFGSSVFERPVSLFSDAVDLAANPADTETAAVIRSFAADVSASFAKSVSVALHALEPDVVCLYKTSDASMLNLLTLDGPCASSRVLTSVNKEQERRLEADGSGGLEARVRIEVEYSGRENVDDALSRSGLTQALNAGDEQHHDMAWIIASKIEIAEILVKSDLLNSSSDIHANVSEIDVDLSTHAPTPNPTPAPTLPTPEPTYLQACQSTLGWYRAEKDQACSDLCQACGKTCNSARIAAVNSLEIFQAIDEAIAAEGDRGPGFECVDIDSTHVSYAPGVCRNSGSPCHGENSCVYRSDCPVDEISGYVDCQNCAKDSHSGFEQWPNDFNRLCCCVGPDQNPYEACSIPNDEVLTFITTSTSVPSLDPMMDNIGSGCLNGNGIVLVALLASLVCV
jgi:hypothetical protein